MIRNRKYQISLVVVALLATAGIAAAASRERPSVTGNSQDNPGTYQLVSGDYVVIIPKGRQPTVHQGVFKINTATGQAWIYREGQDLEGKVFSRWVRID